MPISRTSATHNMNLAIPQDLRREVVANVYEDSAALQAANLVEMTSAVQDVVTAGVAGSTADFTWGAGMESVAEAALKPESTGGLSTYQLVANKMATFVIMSDELLAESAVDLITYYQTAITQRMAKLIDIHALIGGGPFGTECVGGATVTQAVNLAGTQAAPAVSIDDFTKAYNLVEGQDYIPNGWLLQRSLKGTMRLLKTGSASNQPLLSENLQNDIPDSIWGEPSFFLGRSVFPTAAAGTLRGVVGDFSQYVIGIRDELSFSLHSEGTVAGRNLLERNEVALRAEMRLGAKLIDAKAFAKILNHAT